MDGQNGREIERVGPFSQQKMTVQNIWKSNNKSYKSTSISKKLHKLRLPLS